MGVVGTNDLPVQHRDDSVKEALPLGERVQGVNHEHGQQGMVRAREDPEVTPATPIITKGARWKMQEGTYKLPVHRMRSFINSF